MIMMAFLENFIKIHFDFYARTYGWKNQIYFQVMKKLPEKSGELKWKEQVEVNFHGWIVKVIEILPFVICGVRKAG